MATKGKKISEVALENKLTELDGSELVPLAKNGGNAVADTNTIKEFAQSGLDDKYVAQEDGKGLSSNDYTDEDKAKVDKFEFVLTNDDEIEDGLHQIASSEAYRNELKERGYVVYHDVKYKVKDCGVTSDSYPWIITEGAIITANEEGELNDHTQKNVARSVYIWFDTILHYQPYGSIIPSKVSELQNDLKYQTEAQLANSLAILYESLDSQLVDEYTHLDNKKVDKVAGKQLSTEDFTTLLKQKLEGLTNYDDSTLTSELNALKSRLDTILNSENTTAVIDTFQEIEAFLQGVTNTQTLTGLLQEMKSEIVALCADTYVSKTKDEEIGGKKTFTNNTNINKALLFKHSTTNEGVYVYPKEDGNLWIAAHDNYTWTDGLGKLYRNGILELKGFKAPNGTSSQFLKADGSVDSTAYLPTASYTASDVLDKVKSVDGSGSGLDADLLDGVEGSSYFKTVVLQPANLDANELNTNNVNYVPNTDLSSEQWKTKTLTNFPNPGILTPLVIAGGFSLRVIREGGRKKQIFTYYGNNNAVYIRTYYYANNASVWTPWVKLALTTDNVASADKLTTKQLTNEDLDTLIDNNFTTYYAVGCNTCLNKPTNTVDSFGLISMRNAGGYYTHIMYLGSNIYSRGYNGSTKTWLPWKKMLTEDDITKIVQVSALPSNPDSNTLYVIPE